VSEWRKLNHVATIASEWVTVLLERWQEASGAELDYWRVEKPDSAIVIPVQGDSLLIPKPAFRPGVGHSTLDFPGGRVSKGKAPVEMVPEVLGRELGISPSAIMKFESINSMGWAIDSSFSNARLWGFTAWIDPNFLLSAEFLGDRIAFDREGITRLLEDLRCLQCRALLMQWLTSKNSGVFNWRPG
jgi:hypothetical protein